MNHKTNISPHWMAWTSGLNLKTLMAWLTPVIAVFLMTEPVLASSTGGMPWEGPLTQLQNSLTGPVAMALSMIGVTVAGGMLIFGGELGEFARRVIMLVLVIALLLMANVIITSLFGAVSAVI